MTEWFAFDFALFVQAFLLLFAIFNSVGNVPIFLALTAEMPEKRRKLVSHSIILASAILFVFAYLGWFIFQFLGITLDDFKIAGGIILFIVAYQHLMGEISEKKGVRAEELAAFPLATPLLAGPGAISTVIILVHPPYGPLIALSAIILNSVLSWLILLQGEIVQRALGTSGTRVLSRIMGLIIAAIGVTFVREGLQAALRAR